MSERIAAAFAATLRRNGLDIPIDSVVAFTHALGVVGLDKRQAVYWAGRATLVRRPEHIGAYDDAFARFWLQRESVRAEAPAGKRAVGKPEAGASATSEAPQATLRETLRDRDFAAYTDEEHAEARALMADLRIGGALRRSRRRRPTRRETSVLDARATLRRAVRTGGEPLGRAWLARTDRPRRVVLLCDVSGSMEPYSRALLRFAHAAVAGRTRVEAFAIGTRLTHLTRHLAPRDPDVALERALANAPDRGGGTRLGECLREFNDRFGVRGVARGAVVVVVSDGWERGDPTVLAEQMARLRRVAHRLVWVNPLRATPGYEPLARGMAAALPYVDDFVDGHSLASLEHLIRVVAA